LIRVMLFLKTLKVMQSDYDEKQKTYIAYTKKMYALQKKCTQMRIIWQHCNQPNFQNVKDIYKCLLERSNN
jgi:hypothetical protein